MADFEVHIDLDGRTRQIGLARSNRARGTEIIVFGYGDACLEDPDGFSLEPALALGPGAFAPPADLATFGSMGDSAPQAATRRTQGRAVHTLLQSDYLLGGPTRPGWARCASVGQVTRRSRLRSAQGCRL